jgi:hypothetical protein
LAEVDAGQLEKKARVAAEAEELKRLARIEADAKVALAVIEADAKEEEAAVQRRREASAQQEAEDARVAETLAAELEREQSASQGGAGGGGTGAAEATDEEAVDGGGGGKGASSGSSKSAGNGFISGVSSFFGWNKGKPAATDTDSSAATPVAPATVTAASENFIASAGADIGEGEATLIADSHEDYKNMTLAQMKEKLAQTQEELYKELELKSQQKEEQKEPPLLLAVKSQVLLPLPPGSRGGKGGKGGGGGWADEALLPEDAEYGEVLQIKFDSSCASKVLVKMRKIDPMGAVLQQRVVLVERDFEELRDIPADHLATFKTKPLSSNEQEEVGVARNEPQKKSHEEWVAYFEDLAQQKIGLRSIVRPQEGWRHTHFWGGGGGAGVGGGGGGGRVDPEAVWGVLEVMAPPSPQAPPLVQVRWYAVGGNKAEPCGKPMSDREWKLTDVEVFGTCNDATKVDADGDDDTLPASFVSSLGRVVGDCPSPLLQALLHLGGCVAAPTASGSVESWRAHQRRRTLKTDCVLSTLQCLRFTSAVLLELASRHHKDGGSNAAAEEDTTGDDFLSTDLVLQVSVLLYRRILFFLDARKVAGSFDFWSDRVEQGCVVPWNGQGFVEVLGNQDEPLVGLDDGSSSTEVAACATRWFLPFLKVANSPSMLMTGAAQKELLDNIDVAESVWEHLLPMWQPDEDRTNASDLAAAAVALDYFMPTPEVPASLVLETANFPIEAKLPGRFRWLGKGSAPARCLALASVSNCRNLSVLMPPRITLIRLVEAIDFSEPRFVAAMFSSGAGAFKVKATRQAVTAALVIAANVVADPASRTAARSVADIVGRCHPVFDETFCSPDAKFVKSSHWGRAADSTTFLLMLACRFVPFDTPAANQLVQSLSGSSSTPPSVPSSFTGAFFSSEQTASKLAFWHLQPTGLKRLSLPTVCSLDYGKVLPPSALGSDGAWRCTQCGDGRTTAAPAVVSADLHKGYVSLCARCLAGCWADHSEDALVALSAATSIAHGYLAGFKIIADKPEDGAFDGGALSKYLVHGDVSPYVVYAFLAEILGTENVWAEYARETATLEGAMEGLFELDGQLEVTKKQLEEINAMYDSEKASYRETLTAYKEAKARVLKAVTCATCEFKNDRKSLGGKCSQCGKNMPKKKAVGTLQSDESLKIMHAKAKKLGDAMQMNQDRLAAASKVAEEAGKEITFTIGNHGSSEIAALVAPGSAVDRFVWTLPFLRREGGDLSSGQWEVTPLEGVEAHPVFGVLEVVRFSLKKAIRQQAEIRVRFAARKGTKPSEADVALTSLEEPLFDHRASYFSRPESLAAAVQACCWQGVEVCLAAGAPAHLVPLSVAMKLLAGCSNASSRPSPGSSALGSSAAAAGEDEGGSLSISWAPAHPSLRLDPGRDLQLLQALVKAGASVNGYDGGSVDGDQSHGSAAVAEGGGGGVGGGRNVAEEVPLNTALWLRRLDFVEVLLAERPDPNLRDLVGDSPLHVVLYTNQKAVLEGLSGLGSPLDCGATNLRGDTAMSMVEKRPELRPLAGLVRVYNETHKKHKKRLKQKEKKAAEEAAAAAAGGGASGASGGGRADGKGAGGKGSGTEADENATADAAAESAAKAKAAAVQVLDPVVFREQKLQALTEAYLLDPDNKEAVELLRKGLTLSRATGGRSNDDDDDDEDEEEGGDDAESKQRATFTGLATSQPLDGGAGAVAAVASSSSPSAPAAVESTSLGSGNGGFETFENSAWEVELSDKVVRWFRKRSKRNVELCEMAVARLQTLAAGFWSFPTNQKILKGVPKGLHL